MSSDQDNFQAFQEYAQAQEQEEKKAESESEEQNFQDFEEAPEPEDSVQESKAEVTHVVQPQPQQARGVRSRRKISEQSIRERLGLGEVEKAEQIEGMLDQFQASLKEGRKVEQMREIESQETKEKGRCPGFINPFGFSQMHYSVPNKIGKSKNQIVLDPSLRDLNFGGVAGVEKRLKKCEESLTKLQKKQFKPDRMLELFKIDVSKIEAEKELRRTKRKHSSKKEDSPSTPSPLQLSKDVTSISGDQDQDIIIEEEEKQEEKPVSSSSPPQKEPKKEVKKDILAEAFQKLGYSFSDTTKAKRRQSKQEMKQQLLLRMLDLLPDYRYLVHRKK